MSTQLPAHLLALFGAQPDLAKVGENVQNESHAKIRYNGKKWTLIPSSGDEIKITDKFLDIIIVDINPHKSHTVYESAYDPKADAEPPIWQSDDGTPVPVEHEGKVVSDYRRVAVLQADGVDGGVYELRVSAGSITNFDRYNTTIRNHGIPIGSLVTRITFDEAFDYPKLVFSPAAYLTEEQTAGLGKAFNNKHLVQLALGKKAPTAMLAAPAAQAALPAPVITVPVEEPKAARKPRAAKAEPIAVSEPSAPAIVMPMVAPTITQAAAVVTKPQATSADLDSLLSNIMGKK